MAIFHENFRGEKGHLLCSLCYTHLDSQAMAFNCPKLKAEIDIRGKYEDIFSEDTKKQKCITEMFRQLLEIQNEVISQPVVTRTGPMHDGSNTAVLQSNNLLLLVGN